MKNDPTFKLVAAIILAGVIVALVSPAHTSTAGQISEAEPTAQVADATE